MKQLRKESGNEISKKDARIAAEKIVNMMESSESSMIRVGVRVADQGVQVSGVIVGNVVNDTNKEMIKQQEKKTIRRMKTKQSLSTITLVTLFLISYFYLDYIGVEILVKILASGFFVGLCTYILYGLKASKGLRIAVLFLVIVSMGVFFWCVAKDAVKERERVIDKRFLGEWETDTIGGYAIYLRVQADSAYLSQSNMTFVKEL